MGEAVRIPPLLGDTSFRRYWIGQTLSQFGDQIRGLALSLTAVMVLHAGGPAMGLLTAAGSLPALLFSLHLGRWADRRGGRRQLMLGADVARAALLAAVPVAWAAGVLTLPLVVAIAFAVGAFSVLFRVSAGTLFVSLVPRERYVEASALLTQGRAGAFLLGPGAAGLLIQMAGAPVALLADAGSFVASALTLWRIRPDEPPPAPPEAGDLLAGLRATWRSPVLRGLWLSSSIIAFFRSAFFALYILYMTRWLRVTPGEMGIILGPSSIGAVASAALVRRLSARFGLGRTLVAATALYTLPMLAIPLVGGGHLLVVAVLFVVEGVVAAGLMARDVAGATIQAAGVADAVRARVLAAFSITTVGLTPVGALVAAALAGAIGVHDTIWIGVAGACVGLVPLWPACARLRGAEALGAAGAAPREVAAPS